MKDIYSDIIEFRGTHYDFGFRQGELLKGSLTLENRRRQWTVKRPRFVVDPEETEAVFGRYAPAIWEELKGLRDALGLPMEEVLLNFGGYRVEVPVSGCTVLTETDFMIRNYDFHPQTYEGRYVLYQPTDGGYAFIGPSSRITGRTDGMNECGLTVAHNFIHRKKPGEGFVCYMISRILLETCATAEEAVKVLQTIPHRGSYSYTVLDRYGEKYTVEASPRGTDVRTAGICTNHFEIQQQENRHYLKDSHERLQTIQSQRERTADPVSAFRFFNGTDQGIFTEDYKSWAGTIHTSAYFPKEQTAWFALGGDRKPAVFDFKGWLGGAAIQVKRVTGQVETEARFAHMD